MAEYLTNHHLRDSWHAYSAGVNPSRVNPYAETAMADLGISLDGARSKSVDEFVDRDDLDLVVTVCDHARETCPVFHKPVEQEHVGFEDPAPFSDQGDEIALAKFREVRDLIKQQLLPYLRERG
jgi:arsenate reductase (thioredoxin)